MKRLIAFDLDGTLTPSKAPADPRLAELLGRLLDRWPVCVMSGGAFQLFKRNLLSQLEPKPDRLKRLHLLPTCGTRYYVYDANRAGWRRVYAEDLTSAEKQTIIQAVNQAARALGYDQGPIYGDQIEDRDSQITFSALGQEIVGRLGPEGLRRKEAWDPDNRKKQALRDLVAERLPQFEVRVGGATSIDITKPGIDKAYGLSKLMDRLNLLPADVLFVGNRLQPGGNDYPVKAMGVDSLAVADWRQTAQIIETLLAKPPSTRQ